MEDTNYGNSSDSNYTVKFKFTCLNKKTGKISSKRGEVDIHTSETVENLKINKQLIKIIASEMKIKTKQEILLIEINEVVLFE